MNFGLAAAILAFSVASFVIGDIALRGSGARPATTHDGYCVTTGAATTTHSHSGWTAEIPVNFTGINQTAIPGTVYRIPDVGPSMRPLTKRGLERHLRTIPQTNGGQWPCTWGDGAAYSRYPSKTYKIAAVLADIGYWCVFVIIIQLTVCCCDALLRLCRAYPSNASSSSREKGCFRLHHVTVDEEQIPLLGGKVRDDGNGDDMAQQDITTHVIAINE